MNITQRQRDFAALLGVTPELLKPALKGIGLWVAIAVGVGILVLWRL